MMTPSSAAAFAAAAAPILRIAAWLRLPDLLRRNATLLRGGLRALDLYAAAKRRDRVVDTLGETDLVLHYDLGSAAPEADLAGEIRDRTAELASGVLRGEANVLAPSKKLD